jgi:hypothetical protein
MKVLPAGSPPLLSVSHCRVLLAEGGQPSGSGRALSVALRFVIAVEGHCGECCLWSMVPCAVDHSARGSMKNAANCALSCELQDMNIDISNANCSQGVFPWLRLTEGCMS